MCLVLYCSQWENIMQRKILSEFKAILEQEREHYTNRISQATKSYTENQDKLPDDIDSATDGARKDLGIHLSNREAMYLKKVTQALNKIADGSFGICSRCEEEIGVKRLKARPTAGMCIACKEEDERMESACMEVDKKFNKMHLG